MERGIRRYERNGRAIQKACYLGLSRLWQGLRIPGFRKRPKPAVSDQRCIPLSVARYFVSLNSIQLDNLQKAAHASQVCEMLTGFPALLSVAQWADESGWGLHCPGNNCFGIKYYPKAYGIQWLQTAEYFNGKKVGEKQAFATFPDLASCFQKHALLIMEKPVYHPVFDKYIMSNGNVEVLARGIAPIYATDPEYGNKISAIMSMPEVQEAVRKELEASGSGNDSINVSQSSPA